MTNLNVTKIFFDICKLYCDPFVIGIISTKIKTLGFKVNCGSTRINHSINLYFENEIPVLGTNNWYFSIKKKDYKLFSVKNISLVNVFTNDKGDLFAVLLPDGFLPLTVEIKKYDHYQINCNHDPIIDNKLKEIIDNMIMLSSFCADNDHRQAITNVWAFKNGLHATNGCFGMVNYFNIPDQYRDICIAKNDLMAIKMLQKINDNFDICIVNYMNNHSLPDQVTEKKLQLSTLKNKLILEIDHIPVYSRPLMETLIREEKKDRSFSFTLKDLKEIKKELLLFSKGCTEKKEDLLIRLDITNGNIIMSDKDMYTQKYIPLEKNNNVNSCLLCFKVSYLLDMISYCINKKYTIVDLLWEHKKKILDPVLVKCYVPGGSVSTGILMPVQIRDDNFYKLSLDDYKRYRKEQLTL
jgi:hypothetical protein